MEEELSPLPLIIEGSDVLALRRTRDETRVELWALVLLSANIHHRVDRMSGGLHEGESDGQGPNALTGHAFGGGFVIKVHAIDFEMAERALEEYERENQPQPVIVEPPPVAARSHAAVALAVLLCAVYYVSGARGAASPWFAHGAAVSDLILKGEWWRTVTALTLHANVAHLAGNVVACALFVTALFREVGPGLGSWLVLVAGAAGNFANALLHRTGHSSIGFSTAIFATVGILAALSYMRRLRNRRPAWIAIAAGLAILGMLGADKESDTMAHLFGFMAGTVTGAAASPLGARLRGEVVQSVLVALAVLALIACWLLAGVRHF